MKKYLLLTVSLLNLSLAYAVEILDSPHSIFSDKDLTELMSENKSGIIFSWSPLMPYSQKSYPAILEAAKKLKLPVTILVDSNSDIEDYKEALKQDRSISNVVFRTNESETLITHGSYLHFPNVITYSDNQLSTGLIMGAKSPRDYIELIRINLSEKNIESQKKVNVPIDRSDEWVEVFRKTFQHNPMYFIRPYASGKYLPYCSNFVNYLWNLETDTEVKIPGINDPVPTPDEKYLTIPFSFIPFASHLNFYELKLEEKDSKVTLNTKRVIRDFKTPGAYQSVGTLKTSENESTYRVVTEAMLQKGRLRFQEYTLYKNAKNGKTTSSKKYSKAIPFCGGIALTLPMLSKTGQLFGGVDPKTRRMKFYSIDDLGNCKLKVDPGFISAKVDFSFDDKHAVSHISSINPTSVAHVVSKPSRSKMKLNIYDYNFETNELSKITNCEKSNCYYPNYLADGRIMYLDQSKTEKKYELVIIKRKATVPVE